MRASANYELGIGIAFGSGGSVDAAPAGYDFVETSPRANVRPLGPGTRPERFVLSSSWLPVGGACEPDPALFALLQENVERRRPAYLVERLGFDRFAAGAASRATGLLLPAPCTLDGVAVAVRRIFALRERLDVPVAFEIGTNYLQKATGELSDAAFFATVAEHADCGIVLDLASVWANETNGREPAATLLDGLPLERVWEVRVSGTTHAGDYVVDSHRGLVPPPVRRLAEQIVPRLPALRSLVYEVRLDSFASLAGRALGEQRAWLTNVWETRGTAVAPPGAEPLAAAPALPRFDDARVRVGAWERGIVARIAATDSANEPDGKAFGLLATLTAAAREAAIAESAELSLRLLAATVGRGALADLLRRYCAQTFAEALPANEALRFLQFVERERTEIPYLREVVALERAAARAQYAAAETAVFFPCEPTEIFRALLRHDRPYVSDRRPHVVHVGPRGIRIEDDRTYTG